MSENNEMLSRRLEMILSRRVERFEKLTIYRGGFVKMADLVQEAPIFKRSNYTVEKLLALVEKEPTKYTVSGEYIKINEGHKFDANNVKYPEMPPAPTPAPSS